MAIGTEEVLPGGVEPQFVVGVSSGNTSYRSGQKQSSVDEFTIAWRTAVQYKPAIVPVVVATVVAAFIAFMISVWIALPVFFAGVVAIIIVSVSAVNRSRVRVLYRLDDRAARAFESVAGGVRWLAGSRALWIVTHEETARRPAGSTTVTRIPADVTRGEDSKLITNVSVPTIVAPGQTLHFLPDAIVVRNGADQFVDVPYAAMRVDLETTRFAESERDPGDSPRVGSSWLYANRDGSPDRRRANNRELPVLEYARVTLSWSRSGCVLLVSNVEAARYFANALQATPSQPQPAPEVKVKMPAPQPPVPTDLERALQASLEQKRRLEELTRQRAVAPLPVSPSQTAAEWLGAGRSANVHGFSTGDFVYVGNRLPTLNGSGIEPSLINPALPLDPYANTSGAGMSYWPSYHGITAASRRAFLQWLDGGRKEPDAYIGYVFIFFYGLERRVYEFLQRRGSSADEVLAIGREVARLLGIYGSRSGSFASYGGSFLDLIATIEPRARELVRDSDGYGPSHQLRRTLGELALAGRPIPAEHALAWLRSSYSLNTPATRCAAEFELLFHIRYAKQFGEGLHVKPNKTFLDLSYRPASSALDSVTIEQRQIPDITQLTRPLEKLIVLGQECSAALDAFSRFLGKNPEGRQSLAGFALLPEELVEATPSADASSLASLVRSRLDEDGRAHLGAGELLQFVRLSKPDKVSKSEAMLLAQALEKLGYGIEPDPRLGGPVYDVDGRVIVFRRLPDCPSVASDEYAMAMLLMRLAAMVSAADDAVSQAERELLEQHIEDRLQLTAGERQRLSAHLAWLLDADLGVTGLKKRIDSLPREGRRAVGRVLVDVAATDGHVDAREMKILEKLYALLDLPAGDLYRDVHVAHAQDDEPVAVIEPASAPKGFAIPPQPIPATTPAGIDMERVRLKIAETRQVSTLLSGIFAEEEPAPAVAAPAVAQANTIGTLDAAHSELLRRLAQRVSWPREEVERVAGELSLLTDGALETLNDYAYTAAGEPLWEDDDPIAVNSNVAMELTA